MIIANGKYDNQSTYCTNQLCDVAQNFTHASVINQICCVPLLIKAAPGVTTEILQSLLLQLLARGVRAYTYVLRRRVYQYACVNYVH